MTFGDLAWKISSFRASKNTQSIVAVTYSDQNSRGNYWIGILLVLEAVAQKEKASNDCLQPTIETTDALHIDAY